MPSFDVFVVSALYRLLTNSWSTSDLRHHAAQVTSLYYDNVLVWFNTFFSNLGKYPCPMEPNLSWTYLGDCWADFHDSKAIWHPFGPECTLALSCSLEAPGSCLKRNHGTKSSLGSGGGWGCEVSCGGHHRPRGKTTTGSALDGAVFDITQILAYLVHNMSRSQLYLGFGHFGWPPSIFFGQ